MTYRDISFVIMGHAIVGSLRGFAAIQLSVAVEPAGWHRENTDLME